MGKPANTTDALWRFWLEFSKAEPQAVFGGIYAPKAGYHNTRAHHLAGTHRGSPGDYSIQRAADKRGPSNVASALDITFRDAQGADYRTIAKYSRRLMAAGKRRDKRFYDSDGTTAIVREFFGNVADDGRVDGWSWFRERAVTSDPSHLWHLHLSITRAYVGDWSKLAPILDVLLDRQPVPPPPPKPKPRLEDPMANPARLVQVRGQDAVYAVTLAGAVHIKNPTHLKHLRDSGQVTWPPISITAADLAQLREQE